MREVWLTLKKYAVFSGRARRREYWMFSLVSSLVFGVLLAADLALGLADLSKGAGLFSGLFVLAILLPTLAVTVRRLHDTGRSAWWLLLGPLLLVFTAQDSQPGSNQWGNNPKAVTSFAHLLA
ncbi:DUF805 domain-containing protein [Deinococcus irradiatisoli]|uniref:DUF805 domain-containing protein n=1 Tax=Deinococcus irradiatisoli TaxID=2202254 RepID=A0A2Z3JEB2_9DEIO|nr:DUF805 domain-containing protein [Deinococcus irradiatisoli]AWN23517.1 DUF805 domain-containing protein [Deinococcus irradiatisoli]